VKHVLHVPPEYSGRKDPVARAVEAAVVRGIARAAAGLAGEAHGKIVPLIRPRPPVRVDGEGQDGLLAVPSYQDKGKPVAVPVISGPRPPHPMVQEVNRTAELVKRGQEMAKTVHPPTGGGGIFGRMWSSGMAQDTARILGATPADLAVSENRLIKVASVEALKLAGTLLNGNEQVARREAGRYFEPNATVPGSPAVRLRQAATELAALQKQILDRLFTIGNAAAAAVPFAPQAGRPLDPDHFDDWMRGDYARGDRSIQADLAQLNSLKRIYGLEFPILLGRNLDFAKLSVADPGALAKNVGTLTSGVLTSITDLRKRLDEDSIWQLQPLLDATRKALGVQPGTPAASALDRYLAGKKTDETMKMLAFGALGLILALGATVATLGAAGPEAVAAGAAIAADLSIAGAALTVIGAIEQYETYTFEHAAAHSSLDPATALAREDPSVAWLVISVLAAVFDLKAAAVAVRNLGPLAKVGVAAKNLAAFEQAARAQARVLAAEGKLVGTEEQFVDGLLKAARQRVGGSAAAALQHGAFVFRPNANGSRTLAEAVALAERHGIHIAEDVMLRIDPSLPAAEFARYGPGTALPSGGRVSWADLVGTINPPRPGVVPTYWTHEPVEEAGKFIRVALRPDVLASDEAIIAVLAHEMHEINYLRTTLQAGSTLTGPAFHGLVNANTGTLHLEAWRIAIALVERMRLP
jgi:hypothetical protein